MQKMWVWSLGQEDPLEKEMATHFSIRAWEIPWTKEPGGLKSMGCERVGHDLGTKQQQALRRQQFIFPKVGKYSGFGFPFPICRLSTILII